MKVTFGTPLLFAVGFVDAWWSKSPPKTSPTLPKANPNLSAPSCVFECPSNAQGTGIKEYGYPHFADIFDKYKSLPMCQDPAYCMRSGQAYADVANGWFWVVFKWDPPIAGATPKGQVEIVTIDCVKAFVEFVRRG